jgi:hypothetical protein
MEDGLKASVSIHLQQFLVGDLCCVSDLISFWLEIVFHDLSGTGFPKDFVLTERFMHRAEAIGRVAYVPQRLGICGTVAIIAG